MTRRRGRLVKKRRWATIVLAAAGVLALGRGSTAAPLQSEPDTARVAPGGSQESKAPDAGSQRGDRDDTEDPGRGSAGKGPAGTDGKPEGQPETATDAKRRPTKVNLPSQGVHAASDLARLASRITGRAVLIGDTGVERRRIEIVPLLSGQAVGLDELKLLLAFHGVYLFDSVDPEEGEVLVATTDPYWSPRQARYTQVLEVSAIGFKRVWSRLKKVIDEQNAANAARPPLAREADVVGVPVESVGKIFLRAPSKKALARLLQLASAADEEKPPADRVRLFAYVGRYRHVRDLEKDVAEQLSESERNRTRFVVMSSGNRLLYRAPGRLGERILDLLEQLDRRRR